MLPVKWNIILITHDHTLVCQFCQEAESSSDRFYTEIEIKNYLWKPRQGGEEEIVK